MWLIPVTHGKCYAGRVDRAFADVVAAQRDAYICRRLGGQLYAEAGAGASLIGQQTAGWTDFNSGCDDKCCQHALVVAHADHAVAGTATVRTTPAIKSIAWLRTGAQGDTAIGVVLTKTTLRAVDL